MKKLIALLLTLAMLLSIVPAAAAASFTDVKPGAYYAEAVDWAVENGVTTGMSATTFEPDTVCTRGQVVTFLYRCMKDGTEGGEGGTDSSEPLSVSFPAPYDVLTFTEADFDYAGRAADATSAVITGGDGHYTYTWEYSWDKTIWKDQSTLSFNTDGMVMEGEYEYVVVGIKQGMLTKPAYIRLTVEDGSGQKAVSNLITVRYVEPISVSIPSPYDVITFEGDGDFDYAGRAADAATAVVSGGDGNYTYTWEYSWNKTTWKDQSTLNFSTDGIVIEGEYEYVVVGAKENTLTKPVYIRVTVTDGAGQKAVSNLITVSVLSITISSNKSTLQSGQSTAISATVSGGTAPYQYRWYHKVTDSGKWSSSTESTGKTYAYYEYGDTQYFYCVVTDANGNTATSNTKEIMSKPMGS